MASRRFFAYDPYDYYYTAPYHYPYPYYHHPHQHQQPAPARRTTTSGFFPVAADAEPAPAVRRAAAPNPAPRARSVSIPVHFVGSHPEPERKMAGMRAEAPVAWTAAAPAVVPTKRPPSAEAAAVRLQAAVRGFLARRSVRAVREVEREAEEIRKKLEREAEELRRGDARARIAVGEALMRLLLRLDAVRGAREYRRRVTRRVLALQDAVDALEPTTAPEPTTAAAAAKEIEGEPVAVEMAEESAVAQEVPDAAGHHSAENEDMAAAEMEVDGDRDDGEPAAAGETERASDGTSLDTGADSEGEWEMVTEEPAPDASAAAAPEVPRQAAAGKEIRGAAEDGADARRLMEMVAALCERSAQQCAVIGALAERVDALERAVRRVEDAGRRGRRAKKLRKEGKGSNRSKCASAIED